MDTQALINSLKKEQIKLADTKILNLFEQDPHRVDNFRCTAAGLTLDYSKNRLDQSALESLINLAEQRDITQRIKELFTGHTVNPTEDRAALHSLLRTPQGSCPTELQDEHQQIIETLDRMSSIVASVHNEQWRGFTGKAIKSVVNLGIGGSDLGPAMVAKALTPSHNEKLQCYFVSNVDSAHLQQTLSHCHPESTLFTLSSKSFTTVETLTNARGARSWLNQAGCSEDDIARHFITVSANIEKAVEFGISADNILPMWDWVGGRFSLWSAIGLPIALATNMDCFKELLAGAHDMDRHFEQSPPKDNMPVILGLLGYWYSNFWQTRSQAILPYDHCLQLFPAFLQQLEMESNGKSCQINGEPVQETTCPVIWGSEGTNGQHSFHQLLHQGTQIIPADFIVALKSHYDQEQHRLLFANCLAQSRALMIGKNEDEVITELTAAGKTEEQINALTPHKVMPGNRPSNTITMDHLTPKTLGALIALYEHKVFVQSVLWQINAFDQWGVELGKQLCETIAPTLSDTSIERNFDPSSEQLIRSYHQRNGS